MSRQQQIEIVTRDIRALKYLEDSAFRREADAARRLHRALTVSVVVWAVAMFGCITALAWALGVGS